MKAASGTETAISPGTQNGAFAIFARIRRFPGFQTFEMDIAHRIFGPFPQRRIASEAFRLLSTRYGMENRRCSCPWPSSCCPAVPSATDPIHQPARLLHVILRQVDVDTIQCRIFSESAPEALTLSQVGYATALDDLKDTERISLCRKIGEQDQITCIVYGTESYQ